jgi:hypothetical protein
MKIKRVNYLISGNIETILEVREFVSNVYDLMGSCGGSEFCESNEKLKDLIPDLNIRNELVKGLLEKIKLKIMKICYKIFIIGSIVFDISSF